MSAAFTVGELADAVAGGNERAMRKLLNDAGAHLDEYCQDREEVVSREAVVDLYAMRAGDRVARKLAVLLQQHASVRPREDGIYEHRELGNRPLAHCIEIEGGIVVDAWTYQVEGEYHSSGGWEASVIGKRVEDVDLTGYRRQVRDKENAG